MSREVKNYTIMSAKQATGIGNVINVGDFRHKEIVLASAGMGAGDTILVQVQGSFEETAPDFTAAKSATNLWDYIQCIDYEDGSPIDGDTGVTFSSSNDVRFLSVNINGLRWISLIIATISDTANTSVTAKICLTND